MFLWEMLAHRLRRDGWLVWHRTEASRGSSEPNYTVFLHRAGSAWRADGPTLTDAFVEATRKARQHPGSPTPAPGPHFLPGASPVRA